MAVKSYLAGAVLAVLMCAGAGAQVRGVPPSVTSLAPGRPFAPPASVTSLGPNGFNNAPVLLGDRVFFNGHFNGGFNRGFNGGFHRGGHRAPGRNVGFGRRGGQVLVPYAVPVGPMYYGGYYDNGSYIDSGMDVAQPEAEAPAPTVFERRPTVMYVLPEDEARDLRDRAEPQEQASANTAPQPKAQQSSVSQSASLPQSETILVFKDGHRLQITNYAIQGSTLYNLSGEGPRKIALADLNVDATKQANDDRGIDFKLP